MTMQTGIVCWTSAHLVLKNGGVRAAMVGKSLRAFALWDGEGLGHVQINSLVCLVLLRLVYGIVGMCSAGQSLRSSYSKSFLRLRNDPSLNTAIAASCRATHAKKKARLDVTGQLCRSFLLNWQEGLILVLT